MYQLAYINRLSNRSEYIKHTTDGGATLSIPMDEQNSDYKAYLAWIAEGNTPLPADEVTNG
jgi:hypothetical protein